MQTFNKYALLGYLLLIHVAGFAILLTPEILDKIRAHMGLSSYAYDEYHTITHSHYRRNDANTAHNSLIFIGDSHMKGLNTGSISANAVNFGIGGDTISGITTRLAAYKSPQHATAIIVMAGTNDLIRGSAQDAMKHADSLVETLKNVGAPYLLVSIPPIRLKSRNLSNDKIDQVNTYYQQICTGLCTYVDINTALKDGNSLLSQAYAEADGVHLSPQGYTILQQKITAALPEHLSSNQP